MGESRRPLRPQLEEVVGRIRFGDDPRTVYHGLTERVPLETFLLFASALSVQSETGGSLAPTLASVGRTIRDRIEIARRIRSNSAQSEVSTLAVMLLTYFIALVVWRTNPEQMEPVPCHDDRPMGGRGHHPSASRRPGLDVVISRLRF